MIKKIIKVGNVEIEKGLCTIDFNAILKMDGSMLVQGTAELTHNKLYQLLEHATDVKAVNEEGNTKFVTFKHGLVEFDVYTSK